MDVVPTKNGIFIGIDPYPYKLFAILIAHIREDFSTSGAQDFGEPGRAEIDQGGHIPLWYCGWLKNPNHQLIVGKHPIIYRAITPITMVYRWYNVIYL